MTPAPQRPAPAPDLLAEAEVRAAARALLRRPLLVDTAGHDDELRLVRRHRAELARLFSDGLGYRLVVEPGCARLFKTGPGRDSSRALRRRSGAPFTPRGYALLTLVVAALTRTRTQLMVDELVSEVRSAAAEAGVAVDLDAISDRRALHGALVALCDLGVLRERDGDLEHWAERHTPSLLDVRRERLALLVAAPLGGCSTAADVVAVTAVPSAAGGARVAVRRRLVEQPVMSHDELTDEQLEWWRRNRNREREWFRHVLGLELELRAEGAAAIDSDGELTDLVFPGPGSARHFALLLLDALVTHLRAAHPAAELAGTPWFGVPGATVRAAAREVFASWREGFRKAHREDPAALLDEALGILEGAGLLRRDPLEPGAIEPGAIEPGTIDPDDVRVHAAGARYTPRPELLQPAGTHQRSLFEEEDAP